MNNICAVLLIIIFFANFITNLSKCASFDHKHSDVRRKLKCASSSPYMLCFVDGYDMILCETQYIHIHDRPIHQHKNVINHYPKDKKDPRQEICTIVLLFIFVIYWFNKWSTVHFHLISSHIISYVVTSRRKYVLQYEYLLKYSSFTHAISSWWF